MRRFEYVRLHLDWGGTDKGIYVVQYGETKFFSLMSRKKFMRLNHYEIFNKVVGILGFNGWELVSISTLTGSEYSLSLGESVTSSESQEFWFKREIYEDNMPTIKESLSEVFHKSSDIQPNDTDEKLRKQKNANLWSDF